MNTIKIKVIGTVQGVGFRFATQKVAQDLNIKGWVRNNDDGSVSILAQGPTADLEKFKLQIKKSPTPFGRVNQMYTTQSMAPILKDFIVKY